MAQQKIFTKMNFPVFISYRDKFGYVFVLFISFMLFLSLFNPFGMIQVDGGVVQVIIAASVRAVVFSFIAALLLFFLYNNRIKELKYKVYDYILMCVINVIVASLIFSFGSSAISDYIDAYIFSCIISIIPYTVATLYSIIRYLVKELMAKRMELAYVEANKEKVEMIGFKDSFGKTQFYLDKDSILYINANDNYISIKCWNGNAEVSKSLRASLKSTFTAIEQYGFIQCHRSYIVNRSKISMINNSSKKLKLSLKECSELIPVSNSYADSVKKVCLPYSSPLA